MEANLCELQQQERAILEDRRQQQLKERRARRNELTTSGSSDRSLLTPTTLSDIEAVTARPGFLREQLKQTNLTPLRRWYLQLKLLAAEDAKPQGIESIMEEDGVETALQACEKLLSHDRRCYDVVYREGARVMDAREGLLDFSASADVREVLSFSTRHEAFICRVTCAHNTQGVLFSSTVYMENLQTELERFLTEESNVDTVISFIWKTLIAPTAWYYSSKQ